MRPPRRDIEWWLEVTQILGGRHREWAQHVEVKIDGDPVSDPHLGILHLANVGKIDLETAAFDEGRPIFFKICTGEKRVVELPSPTSVPMLHYEYGNEYKKVGFGPELLRSGQVWKYAFIAEGTPEVCLHSEHLVNTNVRQRPRPRDAAGNS